MGGIDDPANFRAICSICNEGVFNSTLDRPFYEKLLIQIRRTTGADQIKALEWLVREFPEQSQKLANNEEDC